MTVIRVGIQSTGRIAGPLIPSSPKFSLAKGGTVWLRVRVENTGDIAVAPYYWFRVHHSSTFGTGSMIIEWREQMGSIEPGKVVTIDKFLTDTNPVGWRDVFLKLAPTSFAGGLNPTSYPGGEDKWASAYQVVGQMGLSILDLTLN